MHNFCTLFDSAYLSRGLVMYYSLKKHCEAFHLYVFAFDDTCYDVLQSLSLDQMTVISLKDFEDDELLKVKPLRSKGEYCWTCTPSTITYVLKNYGVNHCTYLDSDLFFFSSPQQLFDEMGNSSILITPHRYTVKYDQSQKTGIYCVQFVVFKNDERGLTALNWWRKSCIEWCYNRFEDGKFGDQKYLDDWPERFAGVYVCENLGAGVALWNMQQYIFTKEKDTIVGSEISTGNKFQVIFFHFHSFAFVTPSYFSPRPYYKRNKSAICLLFNPYRKEILKIRNQILRVKESEVYLSGLKKIKYLIELFLRRGFQEIFNIKLLHK
jgi:hypothetical protein